MADIWTYIKMNPTNLSCDDCSFDGDEVEIWTIAKQFSITFVNVYAKWFNLLLLFINGACVPVRNVRMWIAQKWIIIMHAHKLYY